LIDPLTALDVAWKSVAKLSAWMCVPAETIFAADHRYGVLL